MGLYNKNGFLSHIPITEGDDIVVFIFADESKRYRTEISPAEASDGGLTPVCAPFFGKYNGYGSVESIVDDANSKRFKEFTGINVEDFVRLLNENDGRTIGMLMEHKDDEKANKTIELFNRLSHSSSCADLTYVHAMEHRSIYDKMVALGKENLNPMYSSILRPTPEYLFEQTDKLLKLITDLCKGKYLGFNPLKIGRSYSCDDIFDYIDTRGFCEINDEVKEMVKKLHDHNFFGFYLLDSPLTTFAYTLYNGMTNVEGFRDIFVDYFYFMVTMRKIFGIFTLSSYHGQVIHYDVLVPLYEQMLNTIKAKHGKKEGQKVS